MVINDLGAKGEKTDINLNTLQKVIDGLVIHKVDEHKEKYTEYEMIESELEPPNFNHGIISLSKG